MAFQNGQSVSDVKKTASNIASSAQKLGSDIKSDLKSDFKDVKAEVKSEAKNVASKVESKLNESADETSGQGSTLANTVISTVASFLPIKNADEALEMFQSTIEDVQGSLITARDSATAFVKKYPLYSLLGAGLIGAAAVMYMSRKSKSADLH